MDGILGFCLKVSKIIPPMVPLPSSSNLSHALFLPLLLPQLTTSPLCTP